MRKKGMGLGKKIVSMVLALAMIVPATPAQTVFAADDTTTSVAPFSVAVNYNTDKIAGDLGLEQPEGMEVVQVYVPSDEDTNTFSNGVVLTEFKDKLYCQWQTSEMIEDDKKTTIVVYSVSSDNGKTWSKPKKLSPDESYDDKYYSSGGWHVYDEDGDGIDDTIVAYLNFWPGYTTNTNNGTYASGGYTYYRSSKDGEDWTEAAYVTMINENLEEVPLYGIFEQDPHVLENGRIVNAAHFQKEAEKGGLFINPIYTDDKSGTRGWVKADYENITDETWQDTDGAIKTSSRAIEPSLYVKSNGNLVMVFRDQYTSAPSQVLASESTDNGESWTTPKLTNLIDAQQKQSAGNLPDGTAFIVNCPTKTGGRDNRYPLTITLSADGTTFTKAYVLGLGSKEALGDILYQHNDGAGTSKKRLGYHYPKSVVIGNYLYISYAKNKEVVEFVRIPLESISLNGGWKKIGEVESADSTYYMPGEMTYTNENGYIIARKGLGGENTARVALAVDTSNSSFMTKAIPITGIFDGKDTDGDSLGEDDYWSGKINTNSEYFGDDNIWYIDGHNSGHIYSIVNDVYYYLCNDNGALAVKTGINIDTATKWEFSWPDWPDATMDEDAESLHHDKSIKNGTYSLRYAGNNGDASGTFILNNNNDYNAITLYSIETDDEYVKLNGTLNYTITVGQDDLTLDTIKNNASVLYKVEDPVDGTETNSKTYLLTDTTNVECVWENGNELDPNTAGTYRLIVRYKDAAADISEDVGVITVNVNANANVEEPEWTKISSSVTYTLTTEPTMAPNEPYLIGNWFKAINNTEEGDHILLSSNTDSSVKGKDSGYVTGSYNTNEGNTANFENVSENEIWKRDAEGKLYNSFGEYLVMNKVDNKYTVSLSESGGSVWTLEKVDSENLAFKTKVDETWVYLWGDAETGGYAGDTRQSYGKATLWGLSYTYAYISGKADYTIESSSTEEFESAIIAGNETKVYTKVVDVNGTEGSITEVSLGDPNIVFNWTNSGNIWNAEISYSGTPLGNITVTGEEESATSTYEASLGGTLSYSIYESETLAVEDIMKAAFVNVTPEGGTTTQLELTAEGVQCVWNKTYNDSVPGTYVMTVLYNGESVGQITVEVKGLSSAWVDVETDTLKGTYEIVYSMDPNKTDGYLITRRGIDAGSKHSLSVSSGKNSPFDTVTAVDFLAYGEDTGNDYRYAIVDSNDVSSNNLWFIDEDNHIYSKGSDETTYYLNIDTTKSYVKYTNDSSTAPKWTLERLINDKGEKTTDTKIYSGEYYLHNNGTKNYASTDINDGNKGYFNYLTANERVIIWAPEYAEGQAALSGTTVYNVLVGDSSVNVSTIQKNAYLLLKKTLVSGYTEASKPNDRGEILFDETKPEKLAWSDPNITYSWNQAFNTNVPGTYVMTVKYNGTAVGSITVNVGDVTWTDITDYTYQRTTKIEAGKYYIITDSSLDESIDSGSAITTHSLATDFEATKVKNCWSEPKEVNITKTTDGYSITATDGATLLDSDRWYVDSSNYIYTVINGRSYYLRGVNAGNDGPTKQISVTTDYNGAISWNAAQSGSTGKTNLTTTVDGTTRYLSYTGGNLFQSISTASTVTLYTPVTTDIKEVGMAGNDTYTVVANNNNLSETYIKANTNFYLKTTKEDGTSTLERIPWHSTEEGEKYLEYEWNEPLNPNAKGTYVMTVKYEGKVVGTVTVNVKEIEKVSYSGTGWVNVGLGQEPDFSNVMLTVVYTDGTTETVTIADGVAISGYDTKEVGEQKADIKYLDYTFEDVLTVNVSEDPYYGLPDATDYPEYPNDGAVRIDKTATNDSSLSWYDTGVTKVELDVAGTSVRSGVDVILVTDISNSMGRHYTSGEKEGKPGQKLDEVMGAASDLADILLKDNNKNNNSISFVTFGGYDADNCSDPVDNRIDVTTTVFVYEQNVDRAKTSFSNTKFITYGYRDENNNKYENGDDAWIQIYDNYGNPIESNHNGKETVPGGTNAGGTNYDYAFAEAINAVSELKAAYSKANDNKSYDDSGRQIVLLFMTDGAPTYYNYEVVNSGRGSTNRLYGTAIEYPASPDKYYADVPNSFEKTRYVNNKYETYDEVNLVYVEDANATATKAYDEKELVNIGYKRAAGGTDTFGNYWNKRSDNWYEFTSNPNEYAVKLNSLVDAFYAVGFKMSEDLGTSKHCYNWDVNKFTSVLAGVAGVENGKQAVDGVIIAEDVDALSKAYVQMTENVASSGTYANVYDEIAAEFTLMMDNTIPGINDANTNINVIPTIEVNKYVIDSNGERVKDENGKEVVELLERVTFNKDANGNIIAYSDQVYTETNGENEPKNIFVDTDTTDNYYQIVGKNFTYTYSNGWEYFDWSIQTIAGYEYAMSYYAYLEGTNPNYEDSGHVRGSGVYDTNEKATLTYVDIDGNKATQTFPVPQRPWGEAITTIEYYLVDKETGKPVNYAGVEVPFANRIRIEQEYASDRSQEIGWGESLEVAGNSYLPSGYEMYSPDAKYKVEVGTQGIGNLVILNDDVSIKDADGNVLDEYTTVWTNKGTETVGTYDVSNTHVAFGVYLSKPLPVRSKFNVDRVVLDYGKAIQVDIFENDSLQSTTDSTVTYKAEIVGFRKYDSNPDYINYVQSSPGLAPYKADYGTFTIDEVGEGDSKKQVVKYQPTAMVSDVEKIYVVIKVNNPSYTGNNAEAGTVNSYDYFYLCQELDIIPATSVYYETDFVSSQYSQAEAGSNETDIETAAVPISDVFTTAQVDGDEDGNLQSWVSDWTVKSETDPTPDTEGDFTAKERKDYTTESDQIQNDGTIGENQTYGYDSTYLDDAYISDGTSMFVKGEGRNNTRAYFTFTGTGFDIISRTGAQQGMITVTAYYADTDTVAKRMSVLNKSESTWGELYQIPVISMEIGTHGTYDVMIEVYDEYTYDAPFDYLSRGNEFYFDAVRIYDPIDVSKSTYVDYGSLDTKFKEDYDSYVKVTEDQLALSAYAKDGEAYEEVTEVRDILIENSKSFDITQEVEGVIFIERPGQDHLFNLENYDAIGPNNEVYLSEGQAIAFMLDGIDFSRIASIDIGAKAVDGTKPTLKATVSTTATDVKNENESTILKPIESSTSQNYKLGGDSLATYINADGTAYVCITNASTSGSNNANVLSITDIKIAYNTVDTTTEQQGEPVQIIATGSLVDFANAVAILEPDADVYRASFVDDKTKIFGNTVLSVTTEGNVEEIEITDRFGKPVNVISSYEDQLDGTRIWTVIMTMSRIGIHRYTITGYDKYGVAGESVEASVSVTYKEGGGWQDAKSIFKTLFNCRILSVKRSSGSKLWNSGR